MRKITKLATAAFLNATPFNQSNTEVKVLPNVTVLVLFGNEIAYKYNDPEQTLSITNAGWRSNTTKERLNALPNVSISQKKGVWYLNGKEWNGDIIDIKAPTQVKFLYNKKSDDLFAFFPNEWHNEKLKTKVCYSHIGQHSGCLDAYAKRSQKATPEQYNSLKLELEGQGYNLQIID